MTEKLDKSKNGGRRPGSGRKTGVPNKKTAEIQAAVAATGLTPLEYMIQVMQDPTASLARRDDMCKAAGPYIHPKLAQVDHRGKDGEALIPPSDPADIARRVAFILAAAVSK